MVAVWQQKQYSYVHEMSLVALHVGTTKDCKDIPSN